VSGSLDFPGTGFYTKDRRNMQLKLALLITVVFLLLSCASEQEPDLPEIETQIKEILTLHTYEHIYRDIIYLDEQKTFLIFKGKGKRPRALFSINIRVQAGIDFTEGLRLYRDGENPGKIYVKMPRAKILLIDADENSIEQFFSREKIGLIETSDEINIKKEQIRKDAVERGILFKAEENAKKILGDFLRYSGFETVEFTIVAPDGTEIKG
jgi:hypothetical protein